MVDRIVKNQIGPNKNPTYLSNRPFKIFIKSFLAFSFISSRNPFKAGSSANFIRASVPVFVHLASRSDVFVETQFSQNIEKAGDENGGGDSKASKT